MSITVKIMKRTAEGRPALYATRDLDVLPVTIGRDAACTIALEDPNKHISRFHVEIAAQDGAYWMSVVSKVNAVMVKGRRYGPGTRLTLQSGDSFELAEYEVQVLLPEAAAEAEKAATAPADPTDPLIQVLKEPGADHVERLFNEATFLGDEKKSEPPPEETFVPQKKPAPTPAPLPSHPLRAFFDGAGLPHRDLSPVQAERLLRDCGAILRAAVDGIMLLLRARASMHKEFDNNPLKRMSEAQEAMEFFFDPGERTGGLLDPVQAIGDACEELRAHEAALMEGMRAAVLGGVRRFDPPALERVYDESAKRFSLASRKARLWEVFVAAHDKLVSEANEDFDKVFGRDFLSAYQAHLRRLKEGR
jgi:predicted component of type VI protein secretion system